MKKLSFFTTLLLLSISISAQTAYVTTAGAGAKNGTSWANAYDVVAFRTAVSTAASGTAFWVAAGTYTPDPTAQTNSFNIASGVLVYGGFNGTEALLTQRNVVLNVTIFSGNINGTNTNNSYHVVTFINVSNTTTLDGVTVTAGNANGPSPYNLAGGIYINGSVSSTPIINNCIITKNSANEGAGLVNNGTSGGVCNPTITSCTFSNNTATNIGGAISNAGNSLGTSSPVIEYCSFSGNTATNNGGAIYNDGSNNGTSDPTIISCSFSGNSAGINGGAVFNDGSVSGTTFPAFTNCVFIGNSANAGGAIYNYGNSSNACDPDIINCTFTTNAATTAGGAIYSDGTSGICNPLIANCILWADNAPTGAEVYDNNSTSIVKYSDIQGGWAGAGNNDITTNPQFVVSTSNLYLTVGSPAINAGENSAVPAGITTDYAGDVRIQRGTVDMGAYEGPCPLSLPVVTPSSATVCSGSNVILTATDATTPISYQWMDSTGGGTWSNLANNATYSGVATASLTITSATVGMSGYKYRCYVSNVCNDTFSNAVILTVNPKAIANAGGNASICAGNSYTLVNATATDSALVWSSTGTGSFDNTALLNATYTPSATDISNGLVTLKLKAYPKSPCPAVTSTMTLVINTPAAANAGGNATICANGTYTLSNATATDSAVVWSTSGTGNFSSTAALHPTYTPSAADISAGSVTLKLTSYPKVPCASVNSTMTLTINPIAVANAGGNANVCISNPAYILSNATATDSALVWSTSGTGNFSSTTILHPTYTPSVADISASVVTLTLTSIPKKPCTLVTSNMTLTINDTASAYAGGNASVCASSPAYTLSNATATDSAVIWSTSGTGNFSNTATLHPTYTPSAADISAGSIVLKLTSYPKKPCTSVSSTMTLTINPIAVANAGSSASVCISSPSYTLSGATATDSALVWSTSGTGNFSSTTTLHPIYTPSAADISSGLVTLTLTAIPKKPCTPVTSNMTLTINDTASAYAGANASVCASSPAYTLSNATATDSALVWSTSGTGSFSSTTTLHPTYTPSAADISAGSVVLKLTSIPKKPCTSVFNEMILTINPIAIANAGANASVCISSPAYTLSNATATDSALAWSTNGTGTFNNKTLLHPTYTPSAADIITGSVKLTLTAYPKSPCPAVTSNMTLTINDTASANAGGNASVCVSSPDYTLSNATATDSAVIWSSNGTGVFSSTTILHPTYTPSAADISAGNVILKLTSIPKKPCAASSNTMILTINPIAVANAGGNASVCVTGPDYTLSNATATDSALVWSTTGTGAFNSTTILHPVYTPSALDISNGSVTLTLTAIPKKPCTPVTNSMTLTINPIAVAYAGVNAVVCASNAAYTLSSATATDSALVWTSTGTGGFTSTTILNPKYTPSAADISAGGVTLTLTAIPKKPCTPVNSSMTLTINPNVTVNAGGNASVCITSPPYDLVNATATNDSALVWTSTGTGGFSSTTTLNPTYTPSLADIATGSVTLTLKAYPKYPCTALTSSMVLSINKVATAYAGSNANICASSPSYTLSGATATDSAVVWSTSGTGSFNNIGLLNATYSPSLADISTGSIVLTLTAYPKKPCSAVTGTMTLTISPTATANAGGNASVCAPSPTYTLSNASETNDTALVWSTSGTGSFTSTTTLHPTYTPSLADIATGSATLTLTVYPKKPCAAVTNSMVLSINKIATAYAGSNANICASSPSYTLSSATASDSAVVWSTTGTGSFTSDTSINATYNPSLADISSGSVILTLTAYPKKPCSAVTSSMTLTISPAATASTGGNASVCAPSPTYTLSNATVTNDTALTWSTSGTGSFSNASILHPTYTPSLADIAAGNVTLTLTAYPKKPCSAVTSTMKLSINPVAAANAGGNANICNSTLTYTLTNATATDSAVVWSTSGTGSFNNTSLLNATYSPSLVDIAAGSVTLTLTAYPKVPCTPVVSSMVLTINPMATANAGGNANVCVSSPTYTLSNATVTNDSTLVWSTSGTGSFSSTATIHPVYNPSPADINAGGVTLTLTVYPKKPCATVTSTMTLSINPLATANAGGNASICANTPSYTLNNATATDSAVVWSTNGTGSFNNTALLNAIYTPSAADISTGSVILTLTAYPKKPCTSVSSSMTLTINPIALAYAGTNASVCATNAVYGITNATAANDTALVWSTTGTGSFNNKSLIHPTYTASAADITAGVVTLTLTAYPKKPCAPVTSTMTLTINSVAAANAGGNASICATTTSYTLSNATATDSAVVWTTNGTGSFSNIDSLHAIYTPSAADITTGSVILTLTAYPKKPCVSATNSMALTINPIAAAYAGSNSNVCATSAVYGITNATATNDTALAWSTNGTGSFNNKSLIHPIYTASAADIATGSVTLTLTVYPKKPCAAVTSTMTLTINPVAAANAGGNASICAGTANYTLSSATATDSAVVWTTNGTGSFNNSGLLNATYTPSAADITTGSVKLTLTSYPKKPCTSVSSNMTLTINPVATAFAGNNVNLCATNAVYTLSTSTVTNDSAIVWSTNGTGSFNNTALLHPIYTASALDISTGSITLTLTAYPKKPCVAVTSTMIITINPVAAANAGGNASVCSSSPAYTLSSATATDSAVVWTTNGTGSFNNSGVLNAIYTPSAADITTGSVKLTLTAYPKKPCTSVTSNMTLTINAPASAFAGAPASVCAGSPVYTLSNATATDSAIVWSSSGTGSFNNTALLHSTYTPSAADIAAGSVTLTLTAYPKKPCTVVTSAMVLTINQLAAANAGGNAIVCASSPDYALSNATATDSAVLWTTSGTGVFSNAITLDPTYNPSIADISAGSVTLTLTSYPKKPCTPVTNSITLTINPIAAAYAGSNASVCASSPAYTLSKATATDSALVWSTTGTGSFSNTSIVKPIYTPSAADIATGSVTLTLTAIPKKPCAPATSSMVLTINAIAVANAGGNANVCANNPIYILSNATATDSALVWSTNGTGSFSNITTLNPVYTPSAADIATGSVTLTLTAYPNYPCVAVTNSMILTINPLATAYAGPAASVCASNPAYTLTKATAVDSAVVWSSSGTGNFTSTSIVNPTYNPSAADISNGSVTLTLTSYPKKPCAAVTSTMVLTINPTATANAGGNASVCANNPTYTLSNATATDSAVVWTTNGTGGFSSTTALNPLYTPSAADITKGSVILTLTAYPKAPCAPVNNSMTLTINPTATAYAGAAASVCASSPSYTLNNATVTNDSTIQWSSNGTGGFNSTTTLKATYTPSAADISNGSVTLTLTAYPKYPCAPVASNMILTINPAAVANAGGNASDCANGAYTLSNATATDSAVAWSTSGTGGFNNNALLNPDYTPSTADITAGKVTLTLTAYPKKPCAPISNSMVLSINPVTAAYAGPNASVCSDNPTYALTSATATDSATVWSTSGTGGFTNTGAVNPDYTPSAADITAGTVTLTITAYPKKPCTPVTSSMTLTIVKASTLTATAPTDTVLCPGKSTTFSIAGLLHVSVTPGTGVVIDSTSAFTVTITPTATNIYTMSYNGSCHPKTLTFTIHVLKASTIVAVPPKDTQICSGHNTIMSIAGLLQVSVTPGTGVTIDSTSNLLITFAPTTTTAYTINYNGPCNPSVLNVTIVVVPTPNQPVPPPDSVLCIGSNTIMSIIGLHGVTVSPSAGATIDSTATHTISFAPTVTTTYTVSYNTSPCGGTANLTFEIRVVQPPSNGNSKTICQGKSTSISLANLQNVTFSPSNGVSEAYDSLSFAPSGTTTYEIHYTSPCTGPDSFSYTVKVDTAPMSAFTIVPPLATLQNPTVELENQTQNALTYNWEYDGKIYSHYPKFSFTCPGVGDYCFTLHAITASGCPGDSVKHCVELVSSSFVMPTAFAPNGANSTYAPIVYGNVTITAFRIYNRWGQIVFDNATEAWDGKYKGRPADVGAYTYYVEGINHDDPSNTYPIKESGSVILVK